MNLTETDRVILINQYEILQRLDEENASHWNELAEILRDGYVVFYPSISETLSKEVSTKKTGLVLDILSLYRMVETHKRDNPADQEVIDHTYGHFLGFDGNNECELLCFTHFLIEQQSKFSEQGPYKEDTDNFNSHAPMVDKYAAMLSAWDKLGHKQSNNSTAVVLEILNADNSGAKPFTFV